MREQNWLHLKRFYVASMLNVHSTQSVERTCSVPVHAPAYVIGTICLRNYEVRTNNCSIHVAKETIREKALAFWFLTEWGPHIRKWLHIEIMTLWWLHKEMLTLAIRLISKWWRSFVINASGPWSMAATSREINVSSSITNWPQLSLRVAKETKTELSDE